MDFLSLNLNNHLINKIKNKNFTEMTPIQEASIPLSLQDKDIIACAKTGSGKTFAFLIPIIQKLFNLEEKNNLNKKMCNEEESDVDVINPSALILAPTRELAVQIAEEAQYLLKGSSFFAHAVYGGEDYDRQKKKINKNTDIIVATPGRLIDYVRSGFINIRNVKNLVLDEADRMLDMGFIEDVQFIVKQTNKQKQVSLYSATLNYNAIYSIWEFMEEPEEILINPEMIDHSKIKQELLHLSKDEKLNYLVRLIKDTKASPILIFSNTKRFIEVLVDFLKKFDISVQGLSSTIAQNKRLQILNQFKQKKFRVLIATDVASRGLDIDDIQLVVNYDIPQDSESYVHRIGRTARAGKDGWAISFCSELDYQNLERLEDFLKYKIPVSTPENEYLKRLYPSRQNNSKGKEKRDNRENQHKPNKNNIHRDKKKSNTNFKKKKFEQTKHTKASDIDFPDYPTTTTYKVKKGFFKKLFSIFKK